MLEGETMLNTMLNNRVILFWCILTLIVCSITITLLSSLQTACRLALPYSKVCPIFYCNHVAGRYHSRNL